MNPAIRDAGPSEYSRVGGVRIDQRRRYRQTVPRSSLPSNRSSSFAAEGIFSINHQNRPEQPLPQASGMQQVSTEILRVACRHL